MRTLLQELHDVAREGERLKVNPFVSPEHLRWLCEVAFRADAVVQATEQALGGNWIITGDGEALIGDLHNALSELSIEA